MTERITFRVRLRMYQWLIGLALALFLVGTCYAAATEPSWSEHVDLMTILIGALFLTVTWFVINLLRKFEANQDLLFEKYNSLNGDFHELKGKCEGRTKC